MNIAQISIVMDLVARELRNNPRQGKTLERWVAAWRDAVESAEWRSPLDVKQVFGSADPVGDNRIVFDICGNSYRIVAKINYPAKIVQIRFAGNHAEYDAIDVRTV